MPTLYEPRLLERILLRKDERSDPDVLVASYRALDDGNFLSLMALAWAQLGWVPCLLSIGWRWVAVPMLLDIALFLTRWRIRRTWGAGIASTTRSIEATLLSIFVVHSLLLTVQIFILARSSVDTVVMLSIIVSIGFCGYVTALQSVFFRLATLNIILLTLALTFGLLTGHSEAGQPLAVLIPFGTLAFLVLVHRTHSNIQGAIRNQIVSRRLSLHDPLTKLPNRIFMTDRLGHLLSRLGTSGGPRSVAVACLDLDGFKAINDLHGHSAGDWALIHVAEILSRRTAGETLPCRIGGDEFVLVLPDADAEAVRQLAEAIIADVAEPFDIGKQMRFQIGVSIGVAVSSDRREAPAALIERADRALYEAKRNGRGTVRLDASSPSDLRDGATDPCLHVAG